VKLGAVIQRTGGLRLAGLMGYEGRRRPRDVGRDSVIKHAYTTLAEVRQEFDRAGMPTDVISAAGTSTLREALADPVITEVQAGTYAIMESDLDGLDLPFKQALWIVATVISRNGDRVVIDAGRKSIASDYGPPSPLSPGAAVTAFNEEHTVLHFDPAIGSPPALGERMILQPGHVRLTFNLHDFVWLAHPDGSASKEQVAARGRSW
jgi:D-serine deaminase-like pyridoxal phosphate-dependent protein